jgi:hypothetical protein
VIRTARRRAEALGTSVNQLVRDYLAELAGETDAAVDAAEFARLSQSARGNSHGWKFDVVLGRDDYPCGTLGGRSCPL